MSNIYINFKPKLACLFTHQVAWEEKRTNQEKDVYYCNWCGNYFFYPSRTEDKPMYRKFL